ncbi:branched-chain amino acid ABC transporter permease [Nocardioides sp. MH1]|uniref:branched-chain amino acid ABC transporter permease n=1 Tax=Nocardioides sp. MH1 TaxID=3242490 RepID=UPI00352253B1
MHFQLLFDNILAFTIGGLVFGSIYALVALGYTMVYGVLQLINFAHSEVFMYGTFAVAWTFVFVHGTDQVTWSLWRALPVLLLALLAAMLLSASIALLLERVAYRPLLNKNAPKLIALISAIGASFALSEAMGVRDLLSDLLPGMLVSVLIGFVIATVIVFVIATRQQAATAGEEPTGLVESARAVRSGPIVVVSIVLAYMICKTLGLLSPINESVGLREKLIDYVRKARDIYTNPVTIRPHRLFEIGGYRVSDVDIVVVASALLMMVALDLFVRRTKFGRGIRAVAQDPESAALMGVNSTRVIQVTFLVGGLMAGAAATLYMLRIGSTRQNSGFILGVKAFTAAVLGGIGNLRGALLGGLVLGVAESYGSALFGSKWQDVVAFVLLVLILLVRPSGLLGESLGKARA